MEKATYVVVDIETTGTNPANDRIIQFGCVFVENNKIISRFATDINPKIKINKQIENLTGISNQQVAHAPYFEDVAHKIAEMLKECIFVAHNIYFDYQFLSKELSRCGAGELKIPGIDTVELAQIFLPTSPSFRLADLAEQYGMSHDRPHQADSDAEVTAELMLLIEAKMKQLPLVTMETIVSLADQCGMETSAYISQMYQEMLLDIQPLTTGIEIIGTLALKKKDIPNFIYTEEHRKVFPQTKNDKLTLYDKHFDYRENQSDMMNLVYDFFTAQLADGLVGANKNFAIEVPTGSGKTFGYLLPLSYLATPAKPVIISTVSILLESQLIEKDLPRVNQIRPDALVPVLVKSHQHYIDLERFATTLAEPTKQKQYALYQMGVLVWLTETTTGDFDELNLTSFNHLFFKQTKHKGHDFLSSESAYYQADFWVHLQAKIKQSNVIVVNHAFLCQETYRQTPILPSSPYLIIDEAHHLPEVAQRAGYQRLTDFEISRQLTHLTNEELYDEKLSVLWQHSDWRATVVHLRHSLLEAVAVFDILQEDITEGLLIDHNYQYGQEIAITNEMLQQMAVYTKKHLNQFIILLKESVTLFKQIEATYLRELAKWTHSEKLLLSDWLEDLSQLEGLVDFLNLFITESPSSIAKWLRLTEKNQQMTAFYSDFTASIVESSSWYPRYQQILYTGGTIKVGQDTQYLARNLGIDYIPLKTLPSVYDYSQQARLYVPTEAFQFKELSSVAYTDFVSQTVKRIAKQEQRPLLVLFTSHEMLQKVYQKIHYKSLIEGVEVLAQGISGSREKIMKRFVHSTNGILLGTDSFWEGIDLPGETLEIIIITRLPFESPDRPFVKEKYRYLEEQGIDTFSQYALPKAALRLRQGLGRLIRSERDRGVIVVLDRRLVKANYGSQMLRALPSDLPLIEGSLSEILADMQKFL